MKTKELPAHSSLGGSGAKIWMNCAGAPREQAKVKRPWGEYDPEWTMDGLATHALLHKVMTASPNARWYVGKEKFHNIDVTPGMADAAQLCADHAVNVRNDMLKKGCADTFLDSEYRMAAPKLHRLFFGTADISIGSHFGPLHIIDYKNGVGVPVDAEENEQMMYYARLKLEEGDFDPIHLHIVQPNCPMVDPIQTWTTSAKRIFQFGDEMVKKAKLTEDPDAPLTIGEWCQFCRAKSECPERIKHAMRIISRHFKALSLPAILEKLTPEDISEIINYRRIIADWLAGVEKIAFEKVQKGQKIPDVKVVQGRGSRFWSDQLAAEKYLSKVLKHEAFEPKKLISVHQAEKLLGKEKLAKLVSYTQGGLSIAGRDDKRKEVKVKFEPITKEK